MAWSIFTQGGGQGAAATWADDLLKTLGVPQTAANKQFIYDWETSEGGGGKYNPLNQGPVPGDPSLTTTGQQFGGGAADFASWQAGLTGAADYINMAAYAGVKQGLQQSNYSEAEHALFQSPWAASHYGYGSNWATSPFPDSTANLAPGGGAVTGKAGSTSGSSSSSGGLSITDPSTWLPSLLSPLTGSLENGINDILERGALIVFGAIFVIIGIIRLTGKSFPKIPPADQEKGEGSEGGDGGKERSAGKTAAVTGTAEDAVEAGALAA